MKNVAGFQSLDSHFCEFFLFSFRRGFGTRDFQNETSVTVAGAVLEYRMLLECDATDRKAGSDGLARAVRKTIRDIDIVNSPFNNDILNKFGPIYANKGVAKMMA